MNNSRFRGKSHNLNTAPKNQKKVYFKKIRSLTPINPKFIDGPGPIIEMPSFTLQKRPVIVDVEQIPLPERIQDVFSMFPTLNLGRMAALERMRMNKILTFREDILMKDEAASFDDDIRQNIDDTFRDQEQRRANMHQSRLPEQNPFGMEEENSDYVLPRRRRGDGYDNINEDMI